MVKRKKKKPGFVIGMAGKNATFTGKYDVNYAAEGASPTKYNRSVKRFNTRASAIKFKDKLMKAKKKQGFKVKYMYLSG